MPYVAPSPVDFDAKRRALVAAVALGTGLPPGQVIMMEGETMGYPRPRAPYVGLQVLAASVKMGMDWVTPVVDAPGAPTGLHTFQGERAMAVGFDSFGRTHEEAYGVLAALQAALEYPPVADQLFAAGLAVWDIGAVGDISEELATTYEGRAHLEVTFGTTSSVTVDLGRIDSVPLTGLVFTGEQTVATVGPTVVKVP